MPCRIAWFTGLSGSGKSTIANRASEILTGLGYRVMKLDGDVVRSQLHRHLGYSRKDIEENNRLIAGLCKESMPEFDVILVPIISPFRESRKAARKVIGETFAEVHIYASLPEVQRRDPNGIYEMERQGLFPGLIGMAKEVPYEAPTDPDVFLDTEKHDAEHCANQLAEFLVTTEQSD